MKKNNFCIADISSYVVVKNRALQLEVFNLIYNMKTAMTLCLMYEL